MAVVVVQLTEEWRIEGAGADAAQAADDTATTAPTASSASATDGADERPLPSSGPSPTLRSMGPVVETVNKVWPNTVWGPCLSGDESLQCANRRAPLDATISSA